MISAGFRLLYHELAWSYDAVAWLVSLGQWQAWTQTALPFAVGQHVLELGHGPGHLLIHLGQQGFAPIGIDASPQMIRLASRRLGRAGRRKNLVQAHAEALPFAARVFDSVVATFPTAYVMDAATLAAVSRVLRPEGRLVIVLGARLRGRDPLSRFIEWLYRITGQRATTGASEWQAAFGAAGLTGRSVEVDLDRSQVTVLVAEHSFGTLATRRVLW